MSANLKVVTSDQPVFRLLIGGKLVPGAMTMDVVNPATGQPFTQCPRADAAQLDEAVAAAKRAYPAWSATPIADRRKLLLRLADALEAAEGEFADLLTREQGKPIMHAMHEIGGAVAMIRAFAAMDLKPRTLR